MARISDYYMYIVLNIIVKCSIKYEQVLPMSAPMARPISPLCELRMAAMAEKTSGAPLPSAISVTPCTQARQGAYVMSHTIAKQH